MNRIDVSDTGSRTLGRVLLLQAEAAGDRVNFMEGERRITFARANRRVNQMAHGLAGLGVG